MSCEWFYWYFCAWTMQQYVYITTGKWESVKAVGFSSLLCLIFEHCYMVDCQVKLDLNMSTKEISKLNNNSPNIYPRSWWSMLGEETWQRSWKVSAWYRTTSCGSTPSTSSVPSTTSTTTPWFINSSGLPRSTSTAMGGYDWPTTACAKGRIWCDLIWIDLVWFDLIWLDLSWIDLICFGLLWFDLIWFELIWFDMIWSDLDFDLI